MAFLLLKELDAYLVMIDLISQTLLLISQTKLLELEFNQLIKLGRDQRALKLSVVLQVMQIVLEDFFIVLDQKLVHLAPPRIILLQVLFLRKI